MVPETAREDDVAERAYIWTIRVLYAAAIGLNVALALHALGDDVEVRVLMAKAKGHVARALRPLAAQREWRRAVNRMHYEATTAVEEVPDAGS